MKKQSELIIALIGIVIIIVAVFVIKRPQATPIDDKGKNTNDVGVLIPVSVTEEEIVEQNFKGTASVIKGSSPIAVLGRSYIYDTITSFKQSADQEVPAMREEFGADSPTSNYEINVKASYVKGKKTESIVIDQYVYTGGANGSDSYKVFTASIENGALLTLSDVIQESKKPAFTAYVKKALTDWRPDGGKEQMTFPEDVKALTFSSFKNWAFTDSNLVIYFDKYEVGPGVLGAIALPIPVSKIKDLLVTGY